MSNSVNKETAPAANGTPTQIDAIKEIIFGNTLREFQGEFGKVWDEINAFKANTDENVTALSTDVSKRMMELEQRMSEQMEKNHRELMNRLDRLDEAKTDRNQLGSFLIEIGNKLAQ